MSAAVAAPARPARTLASAPWVAVRLSLFPLSLSSKKCDAIVISDDEGEGARLNTGAGAGAKAGAKAGARAPEPSYNKASAEAAARLADIASEAHNRRLVRMSLVKPVVSDPEEEDKGMSLVKPVVSDPEEEDEGQKTIEGMLGLSLPLSIPLIPS